MVVTYDLKVVPIVPCGSVSFEYISVKRGLIHWGTEDPRIDTGLHCQNKGPLRKQQCKTRLIDKIRSVHFCM